MKNVVIPLHLNIDVSEIFKAPIKSGDIIICKLGDRRHSEHSRKFFKRFSEYVHEHNGILIGLPEDIDIEQINLKENNVIVFHVPPNTRNNLYKSIRKNIKLIDHFKKNNCELLILPNYIDVCELSEKEMNNLGWYRKNDK